MVLGRELETLLSIVIEQDKLYWLVPFMMGIWLDAFLYGVLLVLFMRWQMHAARTDEWWVKVIVVSISNPPPYINPIPTWFPAAIQ